MKISLRFLGFLIRSAGIASVLTPAVMGQTGGTPADSHLISQNAGSYDELKQLLKSRYDGKVVVAEVPGLYAGEQKKLIFGPGENGIYWSHFAEGAQIPSKRASDLHQLDDNTFGLLHAGLNVTPIEKGERLKVYKFYVTPDFVQFVLATTSLEHMRDLDLGKASKEVTTTVGHNQVNQTVSVGGFGLVFSFHFKKGAIKDGHDYASVVREIDKYLLPQAEVPAQVTTTKTVALGQTPEQVESILGKPEKIVDLGPKKIYIYKDMKVIFQDGKVSDVQ
jgi:hypothetical protein